MLSQKNGSMKKMNISNEAKYVWCQISRQAADVKAGKLY